MGISNQYANDHFTLNCSSCDYPISIVVPCNEVVDGRTTICPKCGTKLMAVYEYEDAIEFSYYRLIPIGAKEIKKQRGAQEYEIRLPRF